MFTGIVTDLGRVVARAEQAGGLALTIAPSRAMTDLALGASVACAGVCLTVVRATTAGFEAEVSAETIAKTTVGGWSLGRVVNLERALRLGDELGGHMVLGHVDGVGRVRSVAVDGNGHRLTIDAPDELLPLIAGKGSIAVDGVSLTVNEVDARGFGVMIVPFTWSHTSFNSLAAGAPVNLEVDVLARYAQRLLARRAD